MSRRFVGIHEIAVDASYTVLDGDTSGAALAALDALEAHGYVIVHPDDVPERFDWHEADIDASNLDDVAHWAWDIGWDQGWAACRSQVFGS